MQKKNEKKRNRLLCPKPKAIMGKVITSAAARPAEMKSKKKKGRPPKNPPPPSPPQETPISNSVSRRSNRRIPNHSDSSPPPEFDDDDERKEKKVKLVVRLPQSDEESRLDEKVGRRHSRDICSGSGSGSEPESEDRKVFSKKRKINGVGNGSEESDSDQDKEIVKETDTPLHGSPLEFGPTTPLPDKKLLVFILDRLQKKDVYGVFSEPVDPDELPDYFDAVKQPMDFGTVRKKIENGVYKNLEELEVDVYLICSNAMQYNAPDTVYYRQARSIQDLATRDFTNLKHEGEDGAPQPKVVRRGRPPNSKNQKKSIETSPLDRIGPDLSSGATLAKEDDKAIAVQLSSGSYPAKEEDNTIGSNPHNIRRVSTASRFRPTDSPVSSNRPRYGDSEWSATCYNDFPASILRADMKYGKKQFTVDENKRDTYTKLPSSANNSHIFSNQRLAPVGLHEALAYARSLARFAANLGPVAWKMASKKIDAVLPAGVQYGPGWVGENGPPPQPWSFSSDKQKSSSTSAGDCNSTKLSGITSAVGHIPSEGKAEAPKKLNSQQNLHQPYRNGFTRNFGHSQEAEEGVGQINDSRTNHSSAVNHFSYKSQASETQGKTERWKLEKTCQQQRPSALVTPEMNSNRVQGSSPRSGIQIGSPKQPDLALQL